MGDSRLIIDVVFDTICPWCYIGKNRLERLLADRDGLEATIRWRPFLLNPQMPAEGIDRNVYLAKKFGGEARIQRIFAAMREAGESVGIDFDFDIIERTPNTVDAHRLVGLATDAGKADDVVDRLFRAYFLEGRNTGERDVLADIAAAAGLDSGSVLRHLDGQDGVTTVYEENARAHRLGINGVPSFLFNGHLAISGAQEPQVLGRLLDVAQAMGGMPWPLTGGEADHMSRP